MPTAIVVGKPVGMVTGDEPPFFIGGPGAGVNNLLLEDGFDLLLEGDAEGVLLLE